MMKSINFDKVLKGFKNYPDTYYFVNEFIINSNNEKKDLIVLKNNFERQWQEQIFNLIDENSLNEEAILNYIENNSQDSQIPISIKFVLDNMVESLDLILNGIDERFKKLDKSLEITSKESDYFDINDLLKADNK